MGEEKLKRVKNPTELTPMMKQYLEIKEKYPDCILFFRAGDFYEMFYEDAKIASEVLHIALTSRDKKSESPVPLCGVPFHSAGQYIKKLLEEGYRVAICEQVGMDEGKKLFKREVVRVYSPGANFEIEEEGFNFVCTISWLNDTCGIVLADVTSGSLFYEERKTLSELFELLQRTKPSEIIALQGEKEGFESSFLERIKKTIPSVKILEMMNFPYDEVFSEKILRDCWRDKNLVENFFEQIKKSPSILISLAGAMKYLSRFVDPRSFEIPKKYLEENHAEIDSSTLRNLEIFETLSGSKKGSLFHTVCFTRTPGGKRTLSHLLSHPFRDKREIQERLSAIEELLEEKGVRERLKDFLKEIVDVERVMKRIPIYRSPSDIGKIRSFLGTLPFIKKELKNLSSPFHRKLTEGLKTFDELHELLSSALVENPPLSLREGGYVRKGFDRELDELYEIREKGAEKILEYERKERESTGIPSLKIGFNRVFGYYIEITKTHLKKVPPHYERIQTLVASERFTTQELKEWEEKILTSEERILEKEEKILNRLIKEVMEREEEIIRCARVINQLDALLSLAEWAEKNNCVKPEIVDEPITEIKGGRHPSLEILQPTGSFVPLDLRVNSKDEQILLITGPNMAGKSTVLRTTAIIQLLAQCGSFVPAEKAIIGIADRIMSRMGASDDITRGKSTFMVEMEELSEILKRATERSLIVLDEIGRGTSTYDGISIAWAIGEYIHDKIGARTLFATHYHELTELAKLKPRVQNYTMDVREFGNEIIFMYKMVKGSANRSYGVEVAKLAGLPEMVLKRAKELLLSIESGKGIGKIIREAKQLSLFSEPSSAIIEELRRINVAEITPLEAINILYKLKKLVKEEI